MSQRIVLLGFMGCGKSTVGKALAHRLGWEFHDLDRQIARRSGMTIPQIFQIRGEYAFRQEEELAARDTGELECVVVAAGGGAFAQPTTREHLQRGATTVWLRCRLETVLERIGDGRGRPLAVDREKIEGLFAERQVSYALADVVVDADGGEPEELARAIAQAVAEREARERHDRCGT